MKLGDITRESRETFKGDKTGIPIVGLEHLIPQELTFSTYDVDTDNTFTKMFHKGQILFGRRRAYLKKAAVAEFDGICSGDITVIEAIPGKVDKDLLPFIIQNDALFDYAVSRSAGGLSPRVKWEQLSDYEINLPPLEEQKVLADKLWAAYRLKEGYKKLLCATDEMVKSQFIEMFGDCVNRIKLSSLCSTFVDGDWIESKDQSELGIRLIQTGNVGNGFFKDKEDKSRYISEETFDNLHCTEIYPGDILVSRLPDPIGRACIIPQGLGRTITAVDCTIIRLKDIILPDYFIAYTMTPSYVAQINEVTTGTTRRRVSRANLGNILIPCPSIAKQQQFVAIAKQADKSKFGDFKSQFIEMFGDAEKKPFVDVCINKGEYGSNSPADDYDGNIRYVRITDITEEGNLNSLVVSPRKVEEKYMLLRDDLLFARTGNTVGKTYLHRSGRMIFAGYLIRYRLNNKLMLPQFAFAYTHTNQYYDWVEKIKKVGAQPNISAAQYDSMPIPVPSMAKQIEFVSIAKQADKSKFELKQCIENIDKVIKSLING